MLLILSDLHFVDGSAGDHNLPVDAYKKALSTIGIDVDDIPRTKAYLTNRGTSELQVLFLGDIFDAFRSCNWLDPVAGVPDHVRPWGSDVSGIDFKHADTLTKTREILRQIVPYEVGGADNSCVLARTDSRSTAKVAGVCSMFRALKSELMSGDTAIEVRYSYIPGNHDRFMHLDPESRKLARAALDLDDNPTAGFRTLFRSTDYSVTALHGHEFDMLNFGRGTWSRNAFAHEAWGEPSFGEAMTILSCKVVDTLRSKITEELDPDTWLKIRARVENIDNIRPVTAAFPYLRLVVPKAAFGHLLDEIVRRLFDEFTDDRSRFVRRWSDRIGLRYVTGWKRFALSLALLFQRATIANVLRKIDGFSEGGLSGDVLKDALGSQGRAEERLDSVFKSEFYRRKLAGILGGSDTTGVSNLVYGHTHIPEVTPVWGYGPRTLLFNTGTFRPRISACGHPRHELEYVTHRTISFAVFYDKDERSKSGWAKRHEFWHAIQSES